MSVLLAFLAFSPAPSQYEEAKDQLIEIQRVDRSKVKDVVYGRYEEALRSWNHSATTTLLATDSTLINLPNLRRTLNLTFKPTKYFISDVLGFYPSEPLEDISDPHSFRSLMEFRKFWDSLDSHRRFPLPVAPPTSIFTEPLPVTETPIFKDLTKAKEIPASFTKGPLSDTTLEFELTHCEPALKATVAQRSHAGCSYMYRAFWPGEALFVAIPVEEQTSIDVEPQRAFLDEHRNWVTGKFEVSFALLNQLTTNIQDLPLAAAQGARNRGDTKRGCV